jgi:hypothetical protein
MTQRRRLLPGVAAGFLAALSGMAVAQKPQGQTTGQIPELPAIEDLSDTLERPLFMPSRRPPKPPVAPVVEAAPVKVPVEEAPADLTGIVNGPDLHYAILTSRATKEVHHLRTGEKSEEWSLQEIGPRYVVLHRGPGRLRLELFEEKAPGEGSSSRDPEERALRTPPNVQAPNMRPRFVPRPQPVRRQVRPPQPRRAQPRVPNQPARSRQDQ